MIDREIYYRDVNLFKKPVAIDKVNKNLSVLLFKKLINIMKFLTILMKILTIKVIDELSLLLRIPHCHLNMIIIILFMNKNDYDH